MMREHMAAAFALLALSWRSAIEPKPDEARGVLQRTIGRRADRFELELEPTRPDGLDAFTVSADGGRVRVSGTSPVAICRGAYEYLRGTCHCQVNWSESHVDLPKAFPDYRERTVICPNRYRHYFNICTFGYSAVWWDWKRWRHEVDWMALHGINMPLALNGQEKIWQRVFRGLGLPDESIGKFFSGPAFLPWHWMGNLNGHGGPLPQSWIDGQAALQKKILAAERGLGMTPVVSGFSGFVPVDFSKYHPDVKLSSPTAWAGFAPTTFVDVRNPMFVEIGKRYVSEYKKEFGTDHFYLCDTFNEQNPQFPAETELSDLSACGKAVYESIHAADPEGTWVMQGWLFRNEADYWSVDRSNALVRDVPKGKMIILDLDAADAPVWARLPAVRDGGWIYNTLHNYGQNTALYGNLEFYAKRAIADLSNPKHGQMLGMGLTMEGIDQNPIVYELLTDAMWTARPIDVKGSWLPDYLRSRGDDKPGWYRGASELYGAASDGGRDAWRERPSLAAVHPPRRRGMDFRAAVQDLARAAQADPGNALVRRDLVDVAKTWLGEVADTQLTLALASFDDDKKAYQGYKTNFFTTLHNLDRIMAVMPEHRLSTWIAAARRWGRTKAEQDLMERNARMQITIWGGPELFDYANKEWAGLNEDFLRARWRLFFEALERGGSSAKLQAPDFAKWESAWTERTAPPKESAPEDSGETGRRVPAGLPESGRRQYPADARIGFRHGHRGRMQGVGLGSYGRDPRTCPGRRRPDRRRLLGRFARAPVDRGRPWEDAPNQRGLAVSLLRGRPLLSVQSRTQRRRIDLADDVGRLREHGAGDVPRLQASLGSGPRPLRPRHHTPQLGQCWRAPVRAEGAGGKALGCRYRASEGFS